MTMHSRTAGAVSAVLLAALLLTSCGITAPRGNDGFANLDSPGIADTDRKVAISLGPSLLRFAARFLDDEPDTQKLLRSLDGVRVRVYEVTGDNERIVRNFKHMGDKLDDDGWEPVMLVRDEGELVQMYLKSTRRGIRGLTVVSADDDEVVVINIMGDIEPALYGDLMVALNIDGAPEVEIAPLDG